MSDTLAVRGVLLAHGGLAEGMVEAVRQITGAEADALVAITNRGKSPDVLAAEVQAALGPGDGIVFTDLPGGSCGFIARKLAHERPDLVVVSGVNLPVLIDFVMNRRLPIERLVPRLLERGHAGIGCSRVFTESHERRSVQG